MRCFLLLIAFSALILAGCSAGICKPGPQPAQDTQVQDSRKEIPFSSTASFREPGAEAGAPGGWVRTASPGDGFGVPSITLDRAGNIYATGYYQPHEVYNPEAPNPGTRVYLGKFDVEGNFQWVYILGGSTPQDNVQVPLILISPDGHMYAIGGYEGTVDFDPGPGEEIHSATITGGSFISRFKPDGSLDWVRFWGGSPNGFTGAAAAALASGGSIYLTGHMLGKVDLDPGPGTDIRNNANFDTFFSKLDPEANLVWARVFGSENYINCDKIAVDAGGDLFLAGTLKNTVDLDPGPGVAEFTVPSSDRNPNDSFIGKYSSEGNFIWAGVIGGDGPGHILNIATDSSGNVCLLGWFSGSADLDPGPGVDLHTTDGSMDFFISKLTTDGNLIWAKTLGYDGETRATQLVVDASDNILVGGSLRGTVDLDPDPATVFNVSSGGDADIFLATFSPDGKFVSALAFGGEGRQQPGTFAAGETAGIVMSGYFSGSLDLKPLWNWASYNTPGNDDAFLLKLPETR